MSLNSTLRKARFEVIPMKGVTDEITALPVGSVVTVTASPRKGIDATFKLSEELVRRGFRVVPHLAARQIQDKGHLREMVERLSAGGFEDVFVIGGDVAKPAGIYESSAALIADMVEMGNRPLRIGIAAYPEGHPLIGGETLMQALKDKQPFADYMVTQICFDPQTISKWLSSVRSNGITLPVYIGIPGVLSRQKLLEISLRVGVGDSTRFLKNHFSMLAMILRRDIYNPDSLVKRISASPIGKDLAGFHIYTFNQCGSTEQWRQKTLKLGRKSKITQGRLL
ncbi:MAG: methylenetetrahydrofolate reductase [Dehalococcoidia bacterium]|nr:methylenetetrahydrofolate reductase [Dehalococcoidia bacterium]MDD5493176.1 methylenetetrahydrofolate reductase [Dehalococcoidia bacterium]